ncbi:hypothetical protein SESBI_01870 [Sesbania bispinosa]|nr:hypothetical protein SESBI_01870 [Sesbania bispinosa]
MVKVSFKLAIFMLVILTMEAGLSFSRISTSQCSTNNDCVPILKGCKGTPTCKCAEELCKCICIGKDKELFSSNEKPIAS